MNRSDSVDLSLRLGLITFHHFDEHFIIMMTTTSVAKYLCVGSYSLATFFGNKGANHRFEGYWNTRFKSEGLGYLTVSSTNDSALAVFRTPMYVHTRTNKTFHVEHISTLHAR